MELIISGWRRITQPHFIRQFIKFCIVGGTSAATNFIFYYGLTKYFSVWYVYSAVVGFTISAIFNFLSNKAWTFRNRRAGIAAAHQALKFIVVMVSGLAINTAVIYALTDFVGLNWLLSWFFANGAVIFWSFSFNRWWTFR